MIHWSLALGAFIAGAFVGLVIMGLAASMHGGDDP